MSLTVAIVEDDAAFAAVLVELLRQDPQCRCLAVCPSAEDALATLPALAPRAVLMDIQLPGASGIECVRQLKRDLPETDILMLTVFDDPERIYQALAAGASGYLLKHAPRDEVLAALHDVRAGGVPMSMPIARKVIAAFRHFGPPLAPQPALSRREEEILEGLARGLRYKEIGAQLGVAYDTIRTHISRIYKKLHVHTAREAIERHRSQA